MMLWALGPIPACDPAPRYPRSRQQQIGDVVACWRDTVRVEHVSERARCVARNALEIIDRGDIQDGLRWLASAAMLAGWPFDSDAQWIWVLVGVGVDGGGS